jgi:preprotein translocase subunit SecA
VASHAFAPYVDGKAFTAMAGAKKQTTKTGTKKIGPNDPCSCGSGKKYKKCCFK